MTSEGNIADTGILEKANQLIRSGLAPDMLAALKILEDRAIEEHNQEERKKIRRTQKASKDRHSRHSGKKKKKKKQR
ncbi:MAG: polymorphic toxin type 34 domain-containing protein [Microcoleus sp.]